MKKLLFGLLSLQACSFGVSTYGAPSLVLENTEQKYANGYNKVNETLVQGELAGKDMSKFEMQEKREIKTDIFGNQSFIGAPKDLFNKFFIADK